MIRLRSQKPNLPRKREPLNTKLDKRIAGYVTAAAGAGLLTLAVPAESEIVYTPCNVPMAQDVGLGPAMTQLDLNNDGIPDFQFTNYIYSTHGNGESYLKISPLQQGNEIWGARITGNRHVTAAALSEGLQVGSNANFRSYPQGIDMAYRGHNSISGAASGNWLKVETAFLGLKFVIGGQVHYGWALVKLTGPGQFLSGSIFGYAYETVPNQPIITGKTHGTKDETEGTGEVSPASIDPHHNKASLGLLATGAEGLRFWRTGVNASAATE